MRNSSVKIKLGRGKTRVGAGLRMHNRGAKAAQERIKRIANLSKKGFATIIMLLTIDYILPFKSAYQDSVEFFEKLSHDHFSVKKINIYGNLRLSENQILEYLNLKDFNNSNERLYISNASLREMHILLNEYPMIKSASIRLLLPDTIEIAISERIPKAIWWYRDKFLLIDVDGVVLQEYAKNDSNDYVVVIGDNANTMFIDALKILDGTEFAHQISSLQLIGNRRWNVLLKNGLIVKLPENDICKAMSVLDPKLIEYIKERGDIQSIDLRLAPERIFLKLRTSTDSHKYYNADSG